MSETKLEQAQWESLLGAKECSCKKGKKVFYYCIEKNCINHLTQPTYCIDCLEEGKHNHNNPH